MKKIDIMELNDEIKNLKIEENIFLDISIEDIKKSKLYGLQLMSMDNLFKSYINNTSEIANQLNLDKFLDKYKETFSNNYDIITKNILSYGKDIYVLLENTIQNGRKKYHYYIDWNIEKIIIRCNY